MTDIVEARTVAMSGMEKFLFLGAVTLAVAVMSQAPPESDTPDLLPNDSAAATESPARVPETTASTAPTVLTITPADTGYLKKLSACPGLETSHAADVGPDLQITDFKPFVLARGKVRLATAPVGGGCFSSPFGMRDGRLHKGVDYYSKTPVPVFAAAGGRVRTRTYRNDYGNTIVIDHGDGVYTRYAHLESFGTADVGDRVQAGELIGIMGHTAGYTVPRHLHYEVLTGTWQAAAGAFALTPVDVMTLPAAE